MTENSLPRFFTPEEVAKHFGWSPRNIRAKAREIGACSILGNRMVMTEADVSRLLDATRPVADSDYQRLLKYQAAQKRRKK